MKLEIRPEVQTYTLQNSAVSVSLRSVWSWTACGRNKLPLCAGFKPVRVNTKLATEFSTLGFVIIFCTLRAGKFKICSYMCTKLQMSDSVDVWYFSPNIIREIKSRRMRRVVHVARMEKKRGAYEVSVEKKLRERDHLEDPEVDGRIILRWIFRKWDVGIWTGASWLRIGTGGVHLWMH